jgi:hypothetical protein
MQLKARHRRDVVEEILDIQIFSLMNMIVKQKLKTIDEEYKEVEHKYNLVEQEVILKEKYVEDIKENKRKLLAEKRNLISGNEEEVFKKKAKIKDFENDVKSMHKKIENSTDIEDRYNKLKDIHSQLKEKHRTHTRFIGFFEKNEDCPTCQQHIDETFKKGMIDTENSKSEKLTSGMEELLEELKSAESKIVTIKEVNKNIQSCNVEIAKENSSIGQLEIFNMTLYNEVDHLENGNVGDNDINEIEKLKESLSDLLKAKSNLREERIYDEASRSMLQDTGIKTKIIKQYLPVMNKLINTYLTSMEFYVNFTLDENFEETIKSRYRDDFSYSSFSEGEKMRIDLALLFTWRAVAKMKNSTNTNLLILDEIFDSSLDGTGTDEFLKILNTLGDENVFVISHKQDQLVDKFRNTIKFEKIKNFSHVVE